MKKLKNTKGITLIALVVTIIVLIILAGISISLVLGNNGIVTKAKQGRKETERASAIEQAKMDIMAWVTDKTSKNEESTLNDEKVQEILTGKSYVKTANATSFITVKGEYEIPYSEIYNKTLIAETYGLRADGKFYCNPSSTTSDFDGMHWNRTQSGFVYDSEHFIRWQSGAYVEEFQEGDGVEKLFCVWDSDGDISLGEVLEYDMFDEDGNFVRTEYLD